MSRGINKFIGIGNCCADPETKYMPSGNAVTNITIACNESWKDKNTGQMQERAEFVRIVFFNKLAEIAGEYLRKGSQVYVEGSLRTRKWQDQSGQDKYTTEIVASQLHMLGGRSDGQQPESQQNRPQPQNQPGQQVPGAGDGPAPGFDDFDDDIPFAPYHKHLLI